jgi:hypothetical protein
MVEGFCLLDWIDQRQHSGLWSRYRTIGHRIHRVGGAGRGRRPGHITKD